MTDTRETNLGIEGLSAGRLVGTGGSATVYAASRLDTGEVVAVKLLKKSGSTDRDRERFQKEQETLKRLGDHAGIVPILDAGHTDRDDPYFLMPLMHGSMQDHLNTDGALDWETAGMLMGQVTQAVDFAHANGVLHRDIKPGNILVDRDGVPRIADFGLAKMTDASSSTSTTRGTFGFMALELFNGGTASVTSDVYALGATLAALVSGRPPFVTGENDTEVAIITRVMSEEPPDLSEFGAPSDLASLVTASMAKEPGGRPASAAEFADELDSALGGVTIDPITNPVTVAVPRPFEVLDMPNANGSDGDDEERKGGWWMYAVAAAAFLVLGVVGAFALSGGDDGGNLVAGEANDVAAALAADSGSAETTIGSADGGDGDGDGVDGGAEASGNDGGQDDGLGAEVAGVAVTPDDEKDDDTETAGPDSSDDSRTAPTTADTAAPTTAARGTSETTTVAPTTTQAKAATTTSARAGATTQAPPTTRRATTTTRRPTTTTSTSTTTTSTTTTTTTTIATGPELTGPIEIGQIGDTFIRYRFTSDKTTSYTATVTAGGSVVATHTGTASAYSTVHINASGLDEGTDHWIRVTLHGPPSHTSGAVTTRTSGTAPPATTPVQLLNLRLTENGTTRFRVDYESNICANGSFVIRDSNGNWVGSNSGQAVGCTTQHLGIPGFWTPALQPGTTYVITVTVEADGQGQGNGNTATRNLTVTTNN